MTDFVLLYSTIATDAEARSIARVLLQEKLIACATVIPSVTSLYEWKGDMKQEDEVLLLCKTAGHLFETAHKRITDLHSYECPCILALPIAAGNEPYLTWLSTQVNA